MMKLFIFSLLLTLCLAYNLDVQGACNTTTPVYTCLALDAKCSVYVYTDKCTYPQTCQLDPTDTTYTKYLCQQKTYGSFGQACATALDCTNTSAPSACVNSTCQKSYFLGVGDACTYDEACPTGSKCNTTTNVCDEAATCYVNSACGFGKKCVATACVAQGVVGDTCANDGDCGGVLTCVGLKCSALFSVAVDGACSNDNDCDGCNGCKKDNATALVGKCAPVADLKLGVACNNATDNSACTVGYKACVCSAGQYTCLEQAPVTTQGACQAQVTALGACYMTNKCAKVTASYPKYSAYLYLSPYPAAESCEISHCKAEYDCVLKCQVDSNKANDNLLCGQPAYTYTCASTPACQPAPTTSSATTGATDTGSSTGATDTGSATNGTDTGSSSSATTSATSATSGTSATTATSGSSTSATSGSNSTTSATSSSSASSDTGSFGFVLVAPFISMIVAFLF